MLPLSHFIIAKALYKSFLKNLNVELDLNSFRYGCIKPDFAPSLMKMSHYKDKSFEKICLRIASLENKTFPETKKDMKDFSMELGIVVHYLTDYFCYPHNNKKYDFKPIHFIYENRLAYALRKINVEELSSTFIYIAENSAMDTNSRLSDFINKKHIQYLSRNGRIFNDIWFSIEICTIVVYYIIKNCNCNILQNKPQPSNLL